MTRALLCHARQVLRARRRRKFIYRTPYIERSTFFGVFRNALLYTLLEEGRRRASIDADKKFTSMSSAGAA